MRDAVRIPFTLQRLSAGLFAILLQLFLSPLLHAATAEDGWNLYRQGEYDQALAVFREGADKGDPESQYGMGTMLLEGKAGGKRDEAGAAACFKKSAAQGHAKAQNRLGDMYDQSRGVYQDLGHALVWYRKSAEQGYAPGQDNLGRMYEKGRGTRQDYARAVYNYTGAANQNYAPAEYHLGLMYARGWGVRQNVPLAVEWVRKSAAQGYVDAMYTMGQVYENGHGVAKNPREAVAWYKKAADAGNEKAMERLMHVYMLGDLGEAQNMTLAKAWARKNRDARRQGKNHRR
jgi:TPR repeat protein